MSNLEKIANATYKLQKEGGMRVPGIVIATEALLKDLELEHSLEQVRNVAYLPGIVGYSIAMPDIHWGYGFPIGGVAATDAENGVISPGGVGYDINCGVRLATLPIKFSSLDEETKDKLLHRIFSLVPSGVGRGHKHTRGLSARDYAELVEEGAGWSIRHGMGFPEDLEHIESNGKIESGDISVISMQAQERGAKQLGSIGSGNHFIEIGEVQKTILPDIASAWDIEEGQAYVLIHSGSRGFGHQICQDTLDEFIKRGFAEGLPDRQLVAAPINSAPGKKYFSAMAAAANFAFNNRQQILHGVREALQEVCAINPKEVHLIYDVCHNIAKFEKYEINGVLKNLCVHRKGATRAFGKGSLDLASIFRETGQPVIVPGDMGRASYLLVGLGNELTWCSSCHGAGRNKSRAKSFRDWRGKNLTDYMEKQGVEVLAESYGTIAEEMPDAYKDIDEVVKAVESAGLAKRVARLRPHLVIKG